MKFISFKTALLTCIFMCELTSHVHGNKNEMDKIKEILFKRMKKGIGSYLLNTNRTDSKCTQDVGIWYDALKNPKSLWPYKMLDSWGKLPTGILTLNMHSFGQFDECIGIEHLQIKGKYCLAEFDIQPIFENLMQYSNDTGEDYKHGAPYLLSRNMLVYKNGVCFPKSCSSEEIENILKIMLNIFDINLNITVNEKLCDTNDPQIWRNADWMALAIFVLIVILVIISSSYDLVTIFWMEKSIKRSGPIHNLLISFSIWTNTKSITSTSKNSRNISCLHGLRSISMIWIIFSHRCLSLILFPTVNISEFKNMIENGSAWLFLGGIFPVDTFFCLSGFLLAFTTFSILKKGRPFNIVLFYVHRFLRIIPILVTALLFFATLARHIGNGPMWKLLFPDEKDCAKNWWTSLIFIDNYKNLMDRCLSPTWYLSSDTQMYILSPIIIYPIIRWKKFGWVHTVFWILVAQIVRYAFAYHYHFQASVFPDSWDKERFHYRTHTRALPWLSGFLLGYFIQLKSGLKPKINKTVAAILWILCLTTMFLLYFSLIRLQQTNRVPSHLIDTSFSAFDRTVWTLCISWIIIACSIGYGGPINWFLSLKIWEILGKLTYSLYLLHVPIMYILTSTSRSATFTSYYELFKLFIVDIVITMAAAYILTVSIELPFKNLEILMFSRKKKVKDSQNKQLSPAALEIPVLKDKNDV